MAEKLYIRLGSSAKDAVHWLIFSDDQEGIIASGELPDANALEQLAEKAKQREVIAFIPASDISLKSLTVPSKSAKAMRLAVPYMLEDELAQDVEDLFFAYSGIKIANSKYNCFVAVVEYAQLKLWQAWLENADITCKKIIPDVLAMPLSKANVGSAIVLGEQILIRQGKWQGATIDNNTWPIMSQSLSNTEVVVEGKSAQAKSVDDDSHHEEPTSFSLNAYSVLPESTAELIINVMPEELPLALLAATYSHDKADKFNLLQGEFKTKEQRSPALTGWLWAAGIATFALLLNVGIKGAELMQLNSQQAQLEQQIISTYKKTFPKTKRVRVTTIRSQLKQKLKEVGDSSGESGFLAILTQVQPALALVPEIKPHTLKFDGKRNEIRMQATASDYQYFDQLKIALEKSNLTVSLGAQNNQGDQISGSFSISSDINNQQSTNTSKGR
ncbi:MULTISPECIES: type II secretion system protein GspL [unclassified Colwellia]|uniref:type II secretion system protein GspL n=1 Tax=unclassified Colwellia TaxID=196834 RepID=UPI0015F68C8A|nr:MULTISPECIES: type II secretion system protein GspL [unclassified Colwellia]MBA6232843.1 type II secretion system protein GspL [Colwellia sp. MB02u-7]MBA6236064.1 type II secretion system protein GspL [Colwellia sp. MB02u-11]MBA6256682.1 type II secretion system protein GspL [Colwellia sp. MB3u-28]MBA6261397.1 type II secretion system protein GspL [Colwellia sp. MB3u-41]MBA6298531.1 type II secretion system protein GspL [Colwellia sp. MB3u-22]